MENSVRNKEMAKLSQSRYSTCRGSHPTKKCLEQHIMDKVHKESLFNLCNYYNKHTKRNSQKPNICSQNGSDDQFIVNFPKQTLWIQKFTKTQNG